MTPEFEKWAIETCYTESDLEKCDKGSPREDEYRNMAIQDDWVTWQAAIKVNQVKVDALTAAIKQINDKIFAAGAPLGSALYFDIRGICCDILYPKRVDVDVH